MRASPNHLAVIIATFLLASPIALYAQSSQKPTAPTLTPNHAERSVNISWTSTFQDKSISSWEVWVWTEQDKWRRVDSGSLTATSIKHTGLQVGIKHWYTYRANFSDGTSSEWSGYNNVTLSDGRPSPPTIQARMDGEAIILNWSEVPGATHYVVVCWCGFNRWDGLGDQIEETETVFLPTAGRNYWFSVQAWNDYGELTRWSDYAMIKVPEVLVARTPTPYPTATPTATPIPSTDYAAWLPGITIAPERNCSRYEWHRYRFNRTWPNAQCLREKIAESMDGLLYDPYSGQYFGRLDKNQGGGGCEQKERVDQFERMKINHVVDIEEAHESGMCHRIYKNGKEGEEKTEWGEYATTFVYDLEMLY